MTLPAHKGRRPGSEVYMPHRHSRYPVAYIGRFDRGLTNNSAVCFGNGR